MLKASGEARELLARVFAAHGGEERWEALHGVRARLSTGGLAFRSRGRHSLYGIGVEVVAGQPRTCLLGYPRPGCTAGFTRDLVWIDKPGGTTMLNEPRRLLACGRRRIYWDDLDLLYFVGYALWNYLTSPWLLAAPGVELATATLPPSCPPNWVALRARFPDGLPTHCREQTFYFDEVLRLRRHDYTAEVFGAWARAVNICARHRNIHGLLFPTRRRVVPRWRGRPLPGPTLVWLELEEIALLPKEPS